MERMKFILITLVLFVVVALAKEVNAEKGPKPAENEDTAKATNPEREVNIGEFTNPMLEYYGQPLTYESPIFKKIVKHCNSHVAQTCINSELLHHEGRINVPNKLALCMFNSMEKCLLEHEVKYNTQGPSHSTQILPTTFENNFPKLPNPVKSSWPPIVLPIRFKFNYEQRPHENNFPYLPDPINPSRKPPTFPTTSFKYNSQGSHHPTIETLKMAENNFVYLPKPINPSRKPPTFPTTSFKYNTQGPHHQTIETLKMAENNFVYLPDPINPSRKPPTFPTTSFKYNTQGPHLPTIETLKLAENNIVYLPAPLTPSRKPPPTFPLITFQYKSSPFETPQSIQYQSSLIENVKFETALKTCTHVTAQTCYKGTNVAKSDLASCLVPSMNQCMYPDDTIPKGDQA